MNILAIIIPLLVLSFPLAFAESSNVGSIYWKQEIISPNSFVDIYVHDDDMNKKEYPNFADKFTITVWSDSSPGGLEIRVVENGVYSGIFKGSVFIADSGDTAQNRLVSMPGDVVYAKYLDFTTPNDISSEIISAAIVKIPGQNMNSLLDQIDHTFRISKSVEKVPSWIKNNAGWWADGTIDDESFVQGIQFLIKEGIMEIPATTQGTSSSNDIPSWIKNNAGWWAEGTIDDNSFVQGIQFLIKEGIMSITQAQESKQSVSSVSTSDDSVIASLEAELEKCSEIVKAYKRLDCEDPIDKAIILYNYQTNAEHFDLGPITYHWFGVGSEGNEFEITPTGQPILSVRMLAENTSSEITAINCTSPAICSYDVWDGSKSFKYSGMDFTSGQIVLNPGDSREFNILFGPNIGYGGTQFVYDSSKTYEFRINEPFGSFNVHLDLD